MTVEERDQQVKEHIDAVYRLLIGKSLEELFTELQSTIGTKDAAPFWEHINIRINEALTTAFTVVNEEFNDLLKNPSKMDDLAAAFKKQHETVTADVLNPEKVS